MNIDLSILEQLISERNPRSAKTQRELIWAHCDTNCNGFASISDVNEEFLNILNLDDSESFSLKTLIKKSIEELRRKHHIRSSFGQDYLEEKEFRLFISSLHRNVSTLRKYERYTEIEERSEDGKDLEMELLCMEIDTEKIKSIRKRAGEKKMQFKEFDCILNEEWVKDPQSTN